MSVPSGLGTTTVGSLGQDTTLFYWEVCGLPPNSSFGSRCAPFERGYRVGCRCAPVDQLILARGRTSWVANELPPDVFPCLVAHEHHLRGVTGWGGVPMCCRRLVNLGKRVSQ